jgi:hypothetical protein
MPSPCSTDCGEARRETFASLSFRFRVAADDAQLADEFVRLYASCASHESSDASTAQLELRLTDGGMSARLDGATPIDAVDRNGLLLGAMALVDGASLDATARDLLLIHASAVMIGSGPVVFVGPSGAGKSTLAGALSMRGCAYIGDEVIGLDDTATHLFANPKPLKLDRDSRAALFADGRLQTLAADHVDEEMLVAPHELGAVVSPGPISAPVAVVRIAYQPGVPARIAPISRADVAEALADQCFNFELWGARGLDAVAALARSASGFRLEFGDLDGAVAQLEDALR